MKLSLTLTVLALPALALAACSTGVKVGELPGDGIDLGTSNGIDSGTPNLIDSGPGCTCENGDGGEPSTTTLACACTYLSCGDYAATVPSLCSQAYTNVSETTYAACPLKEIEYTWGLTQQVKVFDGTTGALLGFRSNDDIPGRCPGTSTPIGYDLAAGTYAAPASCGQPTTHPLCPDRDGGPDGSPDAAPDAPPDAAPDAVAGCVCEAADGGEPSTTTLACACRSWACDDYAATVPSLCDHLGFTNVSETTYAACTLKKITYTWGLSEQVRVFDATTGALLGMRANDDIPGTCPGTTTSIGYDLAAGTYEPPASCGQPTTHQLCPSSDGGSDGSTDAASDARAD